jgi:Lar family restriction alleviation protein
MKDTTAKPCPFCGNKYVIIKDNRNGAYWVLCPDCGCQLYTEHSIKDAVALWNSRAQEGEE